jgi:hypothetical protein
VARLRRGDEKKDDVEGGQDRMLTMELSVKDKISDDR